MTYTGNFETYKDICVVWKLNSSFVISNFPLSKAIFQKKTWAWVWAWAWAWKFLWTFNFDGLQFRTSLSSKNVQCSICLEYYRTLLHSTLGSDGLPCLCTSKLSLAPFSKDIQSVTPAVWSKTNNLHKLVFRSKY